MTMCVFAQVHWEAVPLVMGCWIHPAPASYSPRLIKEDRLLHCQGLFASTETHLALVERSFLQLAARRQRPQTSHPTTWKGLGSKLLDLHVAPKEGTKPQRTAHCMRTWRWSSLGDEAETSEADSFPKMSIPGLCTHLSIRSLTLPWKDKALVHIPQSLEKEGSLSDCWICHWKLQSIQGSNDPLNYIAAGLCHSHSNARSEPRLWPSSQLRATPNPRPTEWSQGLNLHLLGY